MNFSSESWLRKPSTKVTLTFWLWSLGPRSVGELLAANVAVVKPQSSNANAAASDLRCKFECMSSFSKGRNGRTDRRCVSDARHASRPGRERNVREHIPKSPRAPEEHRAGRRNL